MSTVTATPLDVSIVTLTVEPAPLVKLFDAATSRARVIAVADDVVHEEVVGAGQRGEVGRGLLIAPLGVGRPAVHGQADDADDDEDRQGKDDEDLTALGRAADRAGRHRGPHWILALLDVLNVIGPKALRSGRTGVNDVWTATLTQLPGRHRPVMAVPARSTHE